MARHVAPGDVARAPCFEADLADPLAPELLLERVTGELGPVSVLVNNAAHSARDGYAALDAASIDAHLAVNVRAPMLLSALVVRAGAARRIVNLVSGQFLGPMPGELAYTASKGALEAFTRQLAGEVAQLGVTVNAVGPGPNDTGWIDDALRAEIAAEVPRRPRRHARRRGAARRLAVLRRGRLGDRAGHPRRGRLRAPLRARPGARGRRSSSARGRRGGRRRR